MTDTDLVERLRRGDERAFAELVRRHHASLVRVARMYVADDAAAEDVAQDTWVAMLRGLAAFEARSSVITWLMAICANRARSAGVRAARQVAVDPDPLSGQFDEGSVWSDPPRPLADDLAERLDNVAIAERLRAAIDALPPSQRAVVTLRDVEGLSTMDVARLLEMTEANVRVVLHRSRIRLRAELGDIMDGVR
jgi:RNA polymerase sigma-70 factor (ECF subfamily)